jgi:uncharacterized protein
LKAKGALAATPDELAIIREILGRHLPSDVRVYAFGSRVQGRFKPWSDLDLALEGPAPLSLAMLAELGEAFDESDLPWKVDIVDRCAVSPGFGEIIDKDKVPL